MNMFKDVYETCLAALIKINGSMHFRLALFDACCISYFRQ